MSALKPVLAGKVTLEVESAKTEKTEPMCLEQFPKNKHGLIAYGPDGKMIDKIEGHNFGADEIKAMAEKYSK